MSAPSDPFDLKADASDDEVMHALECRLQQILEVAEESNETHTFCTLYERLAREALSAVEEYKRRHPPVEAGAPSTP